ncbi:MAG: RecQ family ATP-dependent DNA helicase [Chitinophagales bacterium]|nr:RecQ family ATP-dependent DNA helicase [Chitinophagales bacterium]
MNQALYILQKVWGYESFRSPQDKIIQASLEGHDVLALLPTGAGKSICYQIPALVRNGVCIIISPLIALMKDQVQQLEKRGINAAAIYTGLSHQEIDDMLQNCANGHTQLLYISPERLSSYNFLIALKTLPISMLAIDEAHCISQWGFDFRPSYRNIALIREFFPQIPIIALTASATPEVQKDIISSLKLKKDVKVFKASFERPNITFVVRKNTAKPEKLLEIIQKIPGTAIVYAANRRRTEEIAQFLMQRNISATYYHAGLDARDRNIRQEAWIANRHRVICCTNAFGMGIDKPDVRLVVHVDVPESLEAYYQEAGRGGRDGKRSYAVLLYNEKDKEKLFKAVESKFPEFEFVKQVYNALYNYLNIAFGGGKGHSFKFNLNDFAKRYRWQIVKTFNALKLLEQAGYLTLNDAFFLPSRIKFEMDRTELYKFQVANMMYDTMIKTILRTYEGVQSGFVKINEAFIAQKMMLQNKDCIAILKELAERKVISYIQSSDRPRITFLEERLHDDNIRLDFEFIAFIKNQMNKRIKAMADYAETDEALCRQEILRAYFGETETEKCQVCDHCIDRNIREKMSYEDMRVKLLQLIQEKGEHGIFIDELISKLENTLKEDYLELLNLLMDEEQIEWVDESKQHVRQKN